jgi:hypothetical protein
MAKGSETKKTNQMLEQQRRQEQATYQPFIQQQAKQGQEAYGRTTDLYGQLSKAYTDMAAGTFGGAGGGGGGGYTAAPAPQYQLTNFAPTRPTYEEFQKTGGIDLAALRKGNPTFEALMANAGLTPEDMARFRGGGVYDEFSRTGGYTPENIANIRARGAAAIPAYYGSIQSEMDRARRIRGGSSTMSNAAALRLAREGSRGLAESQLGTELGLAESIREGRLAGAGGMASTEAALQGHRAGTMQRAAQALAGVEETGQRLTQAGRMWGTEGVGNIEQIMAAEANRQISANQAAAASAAAASGANQRYMDQMRLAGLEGLGGLRGEELRAQQLYGGQFLEGAGQLGNLGNQQLQMRYSAKGNQPFDWAPVISAGIGAAGAFVNPVGAASRAAAPLASRTIAGAGGFQVPGNIAGALSQADLDYIRRQGGVG